jgi:DNA-directed RNA polymerase subunit RPC12/RpoP
LAQRDIGCEDCGAVLPMMISSFSADMPNVWHPGKKCPMCGSERFYPIIPITDTDRAQEPEVSLKRRVLTNPWTGVAALGLTIVIVLLVVFWPRHRGDRGEKALFFCGKCQEVFFARKGATPPVKCPKCGERAGYRAAKCTNCGLVYSFGQDRCPYCGASGHMPLETLEQVDAARAEHKAYVRHQQELEENADQ